MSSISNNYGITDYSGLFNSLSTNSSSTGNNLLSDWASLKNGSYLKLTKAYYKNDEAAVASKDEVKEAMKANSSLMADTDKLKSSLLDMESVSLYEKKPMKDADGKETMDYDYDGIYKKLKSFVDSYNSVIDSADDSNNKGVLRNAVSMVTSTALNQNMLGRIGITVGENNKLSIDESAVKSASINDIKTMFKGTGSYGAQIEAGSTEIINKLNAENNKLSSYTASGAYNNSGNVGSLYDGTY